MGSRTRMRYIQGRYPHPTRTPRGRLGTRLGPCMACRTPSPCLCLQSSLQVNSCSLLALRAQVLALQSTCILVECLAYCHHAKPAQCAACHERYRAIHAVQCNTPHLCGTVTNDPS